MTIEIVSRSEWGALPPKSRFHIETPTPELWLHHTAGSERGAEGMRVIQRVHMEENGWSDFAYSYAISPDDLTVYEGRGVGIAGGHTKGHNTVSHGIVVMGNFMNEDVPDRLAARIAQLVRHGHDEGWWPAGFSGGHRDVRATLCPGENLYRAIPTINALALASDGLDELILTTVRLPANRDATIRRIQAAVGAVVDGDPYLETATKTEAMAARVKALETALDLVKLTSNNLIAGVDALLEDNE